MAEANYPVRVGRPYAKALAANANTSSFASKVATVIEPTNDGVLNLVRDGVEVPERIRLLPYGLGASNDAFSLRLLGWRRVRSAAALATLWVPEPIAELACVVGAATGVAGTPVLNTELFCDTITVVSEPTITAATTRQGTVKVYSPANDTAAWVEVDLDGVEKLELQFDQTTNTPTMNALYAFV